MIFGILFSPINNFIFGILKGKGIYYFGNLMKRERKNETFFCLLVMDNTSATNAIVQFNEQKIQSEPLIIRRKDIPFSFNTLSDEVFLQYLHDSPPIDILFVFYSIFWIILLI